MCLSGNISILPETEKHVVEIIDYKRVIGVILMTFINKLLVVVEVFV